MTEYYVPTQAAESEFTEKRSRFIGQVWPVTGEEEARALIAQVKGKYHDARHNCWCYILKDGPVRYSDDGEPQGTAGQPMLEVFQREGVVNVLCIVNRYFGGVLLGAGGLLRAYTRAAGDALGAAGVSVVRRWVRVAIPCPYALFDRLRVELSAWDGVAEDIDYADTVCIHALLPEKRAAAFAARVTEVTAGGVTVKEEGESFRPVPVERRR